MKYTLTTQKLDNGDVYIELPAGVITELNWAEGDTIMWVENDDGSYSLKKVDE